MTKTEAKAKTLKTLEALAAEAVKRVDTPAAFVRPSRLQLVVVNSDWVEGEGWHYRAKVSEYDREGDVVGEMVVRWIGPNWKHKAHLVEAAARRRTTEAALWEAAA